VCDAIRTLNLAHRSILTLRCFEQLSYAEIAAITGQSELQARIQFFRAKQSLKRLLTQRGFGKDQFLAALGLLATITERAVRKTPAVVKINPATLAVTGPVVVLGTLASKTGVSVALIILAGVIVGGTHLLHPTRRPALQRDPLMQAYATFANPSRVLATQTPGGINWEAYVPPNPAAPVSSSLLETILLRRDSANRLFLRIPERHWVHLAFARPLMDGPGVDILMDARNSDQDPRVFVTDGRDQAVELPAARIRPTNNGFAFIGYDLSGLALPFTPQAVRLEGCGNRGDNTALDLWIVKARVQTGP